MTGPITSSILTGDWHDLIASVAPFASRDPGLPGLCSIHLAVNADRAGTLWLVATATDRYRIARARRRLLDVPMFDAPVYGAIEDLPAPEGQVGAPCDVLLDPTTTKTILKQFKATVTQRRPPTFSGARAPGAVTHLAWRTHPGNDPKREVTSLTATRHYPGVVPPQAPDSVTSSAADHVFPRLDVLLREAVEHAGGPNPTPCIGWRPDFLADYAKVPGVDWGSHLRTWQSPIPPSPYAAGDTPARPPRLVVRIGDDFLSVLMPIFDIQPGGPGTGWEGLL